MRNATLIGGVLMAKSNKCNNLPEIYGLGGELFIREAPAGSPGANSTEVERLCCLLM
jgi:hypothetical protein